MEPSVLPHATGTAAPQPEPVYPPYESEWVETNILLVREAIPPDMAKEFLQIADRLNHFKSATIISGAGDPYVNTMRTSTNMFIGATIHPDLAIFEGRCEVAAKAAFTIYKNDNMYVPATKGHSPFELLRYGPGGKFDTHIDTIYGHPALEYRRVSMVFYMNDEYEGGELLFPRQRVMLKPAAGTLVLFPSGFDYPHTAVPVQKGTKYSVVSWFF